MSFTSLLSTIATLALLLAAGITTGKLKIIDEVSTAKLSTLIVKLGQPFLIINALIGIEATPENIRSGFLILLLGLGIHIFMAVLAHLFAKPIKGFDERKLTEFGMLFTNCGFIGFPILDSIFGDGIGSFMGAFYVIAFHLFLWTWGIMILARKRDDIKVTPKKILFNFGTMPCAIGFLIFISNIPLPDFAYDLAGYLAAICTPISLIISGANIARRSLKKMFTNRNVYYVCFVKLVAMPFLMATLLWAIGLPEYMIVFGGIMAAMPCPAVVTMFGELYRISPGYAAELVGASTVFSVITILPMVSYASLLAACPLSAII